MTVQQAAPLFAASAATVHHSQEVTYQLLKQQVHEQIVSSLDLASAEGLDDAEFQQQVRPFIERAVRGLDNELTAVQRDRLDAELFEEMFGVGPLEGLMRDPTISDILVNHPHEVFVERRGRIEKTDVVFADSKHLVRVIQRIASSVGRRIDESSPIVDARLPDGSKINAVIPPLALDGPKLSIRRFGRVHFSLDALESNNTLSAAMASFLQAAIKSRVSILISGGSGAGKTTLLNALSSEIPDDERIVTIEDSAELQLQHHHVARLETRPANSEGFGEFTQRDLVRNSLRMRPDRIIVGEVRGGEALDMLQAMNTGHDGSLTTIHANDTRDALMRLEMMVAMTGLQLPADVVRAYIGCGIGLVVQVARLRGGVRRVVRITELGLEDGSYLHNDVFKFEIGGTDESGTIMGQNRLVCDQPAILQRFAQQGVAFDPDSLKQ